MQGQAKPFPWMIVVVLLLAAAAVYVLMQRNQAAETAVQPAAQATEEDGVYRDSDYVVVGEDGSVTTTDAFTAPPVAVEPAKPIPVRAKPNQVIGYEVDASGKAKEITPGTIGKTPNSPGTYAVVDMWATGGPVVVPAQQRGRSLTEAELQQMRAEEAKRDEAAALAARVRAPDTVGNDGPAR
jgi:hypothetical protein